MSPTVGDISHPHVFVHDPDKGFTIRNEGGELIDQFEGPVNHPMEMLLVWCDKKDLILASVLFRDTPGVWEFRVQRILKRSDRPLA